MNIVKKVIYFVIGITVIGVVSTVIGVVTQPKNVDKDVTFEMLVDNELPFNVFDKINEYVILNNNGWSTNLVNITINNVEAFEDPTIVYNKDGNFYILIDDIDDDPMIHIYDHFYDIEMGTDIDVGDIVTITFDVEVKPPFFVTTLTLLVPLILSASLIGYLSFSTKE